MTSTAINATQNTLLRMLTENTGRQLTDSGDLGDRHWENNLNTDLSSQPEGTLQIQQYSGVSCIIPVLSVYHFLEKRLEFNSELNQCYQDYVEQNDYWMDLESAEEFVRARDLTRKTRLDDKLRIVNTYNGEDLLSQILQYVYWTDHDGTYVMLQIHGGCDARAGYTAPVAFNATGGDEMSIFDNARATISCSGCDRHWDTDNGCNWLPDEHCGRDCLNLEDYPAINRHADPPAPADPPTYPPTDVIQTDSHGNGYCPYCSCLLRLAP